MCCVSVRCLRVQTKISYASTDGLEIAAYLYSPGTADAVNAGGIVMVHGGPSAQWVRALPPSILCS